MNIQLEITDRKTEKLASALYLLTSFFADQEPMKWRLRELAGRLVSNRDNKAYVREIMSLLTVAKNAGLLSEMNYVIVHREFENLSTQGQTVTGFIQEAKEVKPEPQTLETVQERVGEKPASASMEYLPPMPASSPTIKDKIVREPVEREGAVALKKNSRQAVILNLLKKKKEIQVADVTPLIDGVSEKTVQRELLAMVASGILKKEGEKRWSRYSLAD